jgi:hypothetical protein
MTTKRSPVLTAVGAAVQTEAGDVIASISGPGGEKFAQLFAAAPELLAALEMALRFYVAPAPRIEAFRAEQTRLVEAAHKAIAKATGAQP